MEKLAADLVQAMYEGSKTLVINCFVDDKGETRGCSDRDQTALELAQAAGALAGDGTGGPLIILRTLETKEE